MRALNVAKSAVKNFAFHKLGRCNVCGKISLFVCLDVDLARNNMYCMFCRSSSRKRHVAKIILSEVIQNTPSISCIPKKQSLKIYSTDTNDAFYKVLSNYDSYTSSIFSPNIKTGTEIHERVFCQNLEKLTFDNETFDLVITEDVFEHVRDYQRGFSEVNRVLKTGGYHIFTVPCYFDRPTLVRVDTSTDEDVYLLPPEYHGDKIRGKILAYRTFGIDLFHFLHSLGFETRVDFSNYSDQKLGIFNSYVFITRKVFHHESLSVATVDPSYYQLHSSGN
ncbi:class I SAM-dependent methyltransferase [Chroococcidiopsis thermalis]|uniref:Methyltransferase type 11 n=1 Tax=Chroococcidiopsis thermalis (strain PCC 7203) TaxID=251229 RepID=K9U4J6_CHRTP|nr:class I SAM-dependent methyltransferase [Chroococcidiopsis thermalis]AFY90027.1 Methyltransferase type 11 [Chroococcidiopsis thermalis PCC 7203]